MGYLQMSVVLALGLIAVAQAVPGYNITFVLAATGLPSADDYSKADAFAKLWDYRYDNKTSGNNTGEPALNRFGTTAPVMNNENPEWLEVFSFWYEPGTGQKWHFEVRDHDVMNYDDVLGATDVDVDQFVAHKGPYRAKLSSQGYLLIKRTSPITFKIRATNLPPKDRVWGSEGPSDPYCTIYSRIHRAGEDTWLGETSTITDENSPIWPETFEYASYIPGQNQHLVFKVYDDDVFSADDDLGEALISVDELASKRGAVVYPLAHSTGRATITLQLM